MVTRFVLELGHILIERNLDFANFLFCRCLERLQLLCKQIAILLKLRLQLTAPRSQIAHHAINCRIICFLPRLYGLLNFGEFSRHFFFCLSNHFVYALGISFKACPYQAVRIFGRRLQTGTRFFRKGTDIFFNRADFLLNIVLRLREIRLVAFCQFAVLRL